jgi:hypothetical protein
METKTKVLAKVIDDETRIEAAKYASWDVKSTTQYSKEDIMQDAWILLGGRMGQPFYSALRYTVGDINRELYGRDMKDEAYNRKYLLKHGSYGFDSDWFVNKEDLEKHDLNLEFEDVYEELLLFARAIKKEDALIALAYANDPVKFLMNSRETSKEGASQRLTIFRRQVKEHYDFEFFA